MSTLPAFPGAEGPGAQSIGGRGGQVIEVTNLNNSGTGSLRAACEASGPRTVIFKVAGVIDLNGTTIRITNPYITIAGQTAPEGGITLKGHELGMNTHDVICRFITVRTGTEYPLADQEGDAIAMLGQGDLHDNIVDHCSMSWAHDENAQIWAWSSIAPYNISYSWNIISEGLDGHSTGLIAGTSGNVVDFKDISVHNNIFATNSHRLPLLKIASGSVVNNLIYNWHWWGTGLNGGGNYDVIGNSYVVGPETYAAIRQEIICEHPDGDVDTSSSNSAPGLISIYVSGNKGPSNSDEYADNWGMVYHKNLDGSRPPMETIYRSLTQQNTYLFPITVRDTATMEAELLADAGNSRRINENGEWVSNRDIVDARIIADFNARTGTIPIDENEVGGYPTIPAATGYVDTTGSGMSDVWEAAHGLDVDPNKVVNSEGYTNLEAFINGLNPISSIGNGDISPPGIPSTEVFGSAIVSGDVVALHVPGDYATIQLAVDNAVDGDLILLAPGTHHVLGNLYIDKSDLTFASYYYTTGDESYIDSTIVTGINGPSTTRIFDCVLGSSYNTTLIGFTVRDAEKLVTFTEDYGIVYKCKFFNSGADSISFDTNAGGSVTYCYVQGSGDDAIDIDTRYDGSFEIAYNTLLDCGDDAIEIHFYSSASTKHMFYNIHHNFISGQGEDGLQLIDYSNLTNRSMDVHHNIFEGSPDAAIGTMFEQTVETGAGSAMAERLRIFNNYFYNNGWHITGGDDMIVLNNIFESASIAAVKRVKTNSIVDHNLFYNNAADVVDSITGANNIYGVNPLRNVDFSLQSGSPAIDAGVASYTHNSELVLDMQPGEYLGVSPDIGSTEYLNGNLSVSPAGIVSEEAFGNALVSDGTIRVNGIASEEAFGVPAVAHFGAQSLQIRIANGTDDAEEYIADGATHTTASSDLELVIDGLTAQMVGVRFPNAAIPVNATIINAYIQFQVDEPDDGDAAPLTVAGHLTPNPATFSTTPYDISSRPTTTATVAWQPPTWLTPGEQGPDQRTSNLAPIVQELIDQTGWAPGNAMAFIISGSSGTRTAESYDGDPAGAPMLVVEYVEEVVSTLQTISAPGILGAEALGVPALTVGAVALEPTGIASAEALGVPAVTVGAVTLEPTGIAGAEAFGVASLVVPTVVVSGIASAESFGDTWIGESKEFFLRKNIYQGKTNQEILGILMEDDSELLRVIEIIRGFIL